jgi:uncharacterized protein YgiM (DUF1202 family)
MQLFLSYAHVDKPIVKSWIVDTLLSGSHDVWFDERLVAGGDWKQQLFKAIQQRDALVFCITPESIKSEWCQWELAQAVKLGKPILPVLLQGRTTIPESLSDIQIVDFSNGATSDAVARLMGGLQKLSTTQVTFAPINPKGKPTEVMTNEKSSRTHLVRNIFGGITATILFLATVTSALPEQTRNNIFIGLGVLQPSPTPTLTHTPTLEPTQTPTSTSTETNTPTPTFAPTETSTNTPVATSSTPIVSADESTIIRIGPSADFDVLLEWNGRELDILGISEDGLWYQILLRDGRKGWVITSQTVVQVRGDRSIIPTIAVTNTPTQIPTKTFTPIIIPSETPTLTVTSSPTLTPSVTDTLIPSNTPLRPPTSTPSNTPSPTVTPSQCLGTIPGAVGMINQVKVLPNTSSPARPPVQRGSTVIIVDRESDFGLTWYQIEYDGNIGWIIDEYVELLRDCT